MQNKYKSLSEIQKKFEKILKQKNVYDIIVFGSYAKGKINPSDIDIAIICENKEKINQNDLKDFHISFLKPLDFFEKIPSLVNTLLKEGISLKSKKDFMKNYGFKNKVRFIYELKNENSSKKVKIVNILRGKNKGKGMVEENEGEWISNGIFECTPKKEFLFEEFFIHHQIKFQKNNLLID